MPNAEVCDWRGVTGIRCASEGGEPAIATTYRTVDDVDIPLCRQHAAEWDKDHNGR